MGSTPVEKSRSFDNLHFVPCFVLVRFRTFDKYGRFDSNLQRLRFRMLSFLHAQTSDTHLVSSFSQWAYLLSLKFLPHESSQTKAQARLKLLAVLLAVSGVFVIAYGDSIWGDKTSDGPEGSNRILGNGLALFGSIAYAGYEVWYKIKVSFLPELVRLPQKRS